MCPISVTVAMSLPVQGGTCHQPHTSEMDTHLRKPALRSCSVPSDHDRGVAPAGRTGAARNWHLAGPRQQQVRHRSHDGMHPGPGPAPLPGAAQAAFPARTVTAPDLTSLHRAGWKTWHSRINDVYPCRYHRASLPRDWTPGLLTKWESEAARIPIFLARLVMVGFCSIVGPIPVTPGAKVASVQKSLVNT